MPTRLVTTNEGDVELKPESLTIIVLGLVLGLLIGINAKPGSRQNYLEIENQRLRDEIRRNETPKDPGAVMVEWWRLEGDEWVYSHMMHYPSRDAIPKRPKHGRNRYPYPPETIWDAR